MAGGFFSAWLIGENSLVTECALVPASVLCLPRRLAINFHDALLPADAGVHASAWAVANSANRHGADRHGTNRHGTNRHGTNRHGDQSEREPGLQAGRPGFIP